MSMNGVRPEVEGQAPPPPADLCEHDWQWGATMDMEPPIYSRSCGLCGLAQSSQAPPFGDGEWHNVEQPDAAAGHAICLECEGERPRRETSSEQ